MRPPRLRPALALLLALLAGCGFLPAARPPAAVSFMVFGDPAELAAYQRLVAAFGAAHPDIAVELAHIPGQSDYRKRLAADFAAGDPADVVLLNYRRYAPYAAKGALEPLGPYLAGSTRIAEADFYPEALAPFRWRGELACIPQNLSSLVVYYNRDLFAAAGLPLPRAGWTWDDFLAAARALTRDTDGDGTTDQYGLGTEVELIRLAPFVWQAGGAITDDPAAPNALALTSPAAVAAARWFVELQTRHGVAPDAAAEEAEASESRFLGGRLGMLLNSRRGVPTYREITGFTWDVAPLPTPAGGTPASVLHSDAYCMTAATANKPAAWTFIEFANSPEGQRIVAESGRTVPSLRAVAESPAFLDPARPPASSRVFLDVIPTLRALPVLEQWPEIEEVAGAELKRAFYGQAPLEEALAAMDERTRPLFARPEP